MGFISMSIALGVLIGPVVGGVLYHNYGYLAVFISGYAVRLLSRCSSQGSLIAGGLPRYVPYFP